MNDHERTRLATCIAALFITTHGALHAADLPQVLSGVNARFDGAAIRVPLPGEVADPTRMVIEQTADKATLHWQQFDIGAGHEVEFVQPSTSSVALNRIFDAAPSRIAGRLTANGQVYLINANGIVFADGAQVSTQSLVASTLDIDGEVFEQIGFVNAINDSTGALAAFDSLGVPMGEIHIESGAMIEAARTGRVLIFAPKIHNAGTIVTPEGQQVLAAAQDRVLIAASESPDLRGLLVEVGTGGEVGNVGTLIAERGNISLLGLAVNQDGIARATTSVSLNGSIRLVAQDMNGTLALANDLVPRRPKPVRGGTLHLGEGSITEVIPDTSPDADGNAVLALDAQAQGRSRIDLAGTRVELAAGARVTATGGLINVTAAADPGAPDLRQPGDPTALASELRIAAGAILDASGDDTTEVSVARNVVEVEARGNELADAPVQRDGPLRNQTLRVDLRRGTPLLNTDGAAAALQRSAAERQSTGGSITLRSEGAVVIEEGALVDVSGGRVTYTAGEVRTSRLQQANGQVVGIANADPDQTYVRMVDDAVVREAGYVEGKDAGTLTVEGRGITLSGDVAAGAAAGVHQRWQPQDLTATGSPAWARPWDEVPRAGTLALSLLRAGLPELHIGGPGASAASGVAPLVIPVSQLVASGAGQLAFINAGAVFLDDDLQLPAWGSLGLTGTQVVVGGAVRAPGGQVTLTASNQRVGAQVADQLRMVRIDSTVDLSGTWVNDNPLLVRGRPTAPVVLDGGALRIDSGASIAIGEAAVLDVGAGAWRDADGRFSGGDGGLLSFLTGETDNLLWGARLDIGGELRGYGFSAGGTLVIDSERLRVVASPLPAPGDDPRLFGHRQFGLREVADGAGNVQYVIEIADDTFRQGGFSSYRLASSRADLAIDGAASPSLRAARLQLTGSSPGRLPGSSAISAVAAPAYVLPWERLPLELSLVSTDRLSNAIGPVAGLDIGRGAHLVADPGSVIRLQSTGSIFVDGTVEAPGGTITLDIGGGPGVFRPETMIRLGDAAHLSVDGTVIVDESDPVGLRRGVVQAGGTVRLRAAQGSVVGAPGARIGADGTVGDLDIGDGIPRRTSLASAAGVIELTAAESLLWQGALSAAAPAGSHATGGRLLVGLDASARGIAPLLGPDGIPRGPHTLVMQDFEGEIPDAGAAVDAAWYSTGFLPLAALQSGGFDALDVSVRSSAVNTDRNTGAPVPDTPDSLPVIAFRRELDLQLERSIVLDAAVFDGDGVDVRLAAPYVALGYDDARVALDGALPDKTGVVNPRDATLPIRLTPTAGSARLSVDAELIELVGESVTRGFGDATTGRVGVALHSRGDLRLRGVRKTLRSEYAGLFRTAGDLDVEALRVYPTTLSRFELAVEGDGGTLSLSGGGGTDVPYSVGAAVRFAADHIVQAGTLHAPLGELSLVAGSSLRFTAGSLTSTSAAGLSAPFFLTEPGGALILPAPSASEDQLVFVAAVDNPEYERLLPAKRIALDAPDIELAAGSRFDVGGGGDVRATAFVPGPGGSRDILRADQAGASFALLPGVGPFAPWDPLESPVVADVQARRIGDTLLLEEGLPGLPAGEYAILPARYALFGGYLVTPAAGTGDLRPGQGLQQADGAPVLAGRHAVAGNDRSAGRTQGFVVEDGARVRRRAEYLETPLDEFYTGVAAGAPRDGGDLVIEAGERLDLRAELVRGAPTGGLGSAVDIASRAAMRVVDGLTAGEGIVLRAADLAALGADSLLLGGTRTRGVDALTLEATSSEVVIGDGVALTLPELLLTGTRIVIGDAGLAPVVLSADAATGEGHALLALHGDAAVVAVSGRELSVERQSAPTALSTIDLAATATLSARGSVVLDAADSVEAAGLLDTGDGVLALGARRITLGGSGDADGLRLDETTLARLAGSALRLRSSELIDLVGGLQGGAPDAPLSFARLTFDAPGLRGLDNADATAWLQAEVLELRNSGPVLTAQPVVAAAGSALRLDAGTLRLGEGDVQLRGYAGVTLAASDSLLFSGDQALSAGGDLRLDAPVILATQATRSRVQVDGTLSVRGGEAAATDVPPGGPGAGLSFTAADIDFDGRVRLPSGAFALTRADDGDDGSLRLGSHAQVDVSGTALVFGPQTVATPGGTIALRAEAGDLTLAEGVQLDVSAPLEAGTVSLMAPGGTVHLGDGVALSAHDETGHGGHFVLDAATLVDGGGVAGHALQGLVALLESTGFGASRALRLRDQDLVIGAGDTLTAHDIRLVSDRGDIIIDGLLDASGDRGGRIWLAAGDRVVLSGTLRARGEGAGAAGGRIDLYALDADGDSLVGADATVDLLEGSHIDVAGGALGEGGVVDIHVRRLDTDGNGQTETVAHGALAATVDGAARTRVIATRVLRDPAATAVLDPATGGLVTRVTASRARIDGWRDETAAFMAGRPSPVLDGFDVVAGLQVESSGDLVVADRWDLNDGWDFGAHGEGAGFITLRAARDLDLDADLSDAFTQRGIVFGFFMVDALDPVPAAGPAADWGWRLAAGASLDSADVLATRAGSGLLDLGTGVRVRTGSGDIDIAAGGDVRLRDGAAIYAAGRDLGTSASLRALLDETLVAQGLTTDEFFALFLNAGQFATGGGDVRLRAGGRLHADSSAGGVTAWLTRIGSGVFGTDLYADGAGFGAVPTHWSVVFDRFRNGVGAFGGGDLDVSVAGDIDDVLLALPTTGRADEGVTALTAGGQVVFTPSARTTETLGGGVLRVHAGGDFTGGQVVLGRGQGVLRTGGTVGRGAAPRVYLGGETTFDWQATQGLTIAGLLDPTVEALDDSQLALMQALFSNIRVTADIDNRFYTWGSGMRVALGTLGGDVTLDGEGFGGFVPPSLSLVSAGGDINIVATPLVFFPAADGQLELLARDDITGNFFGSTETRLTQSDQERSTLPSVDRPDIVSAPAIPARVPVHADDPRRNVIVAQQGSVQSLPGQPGYWTLEMAKPTWLQAGTDLRNLSLRIQHIATTDLSSVQAGRDIVQGDLRTNTGRFAANDRRIFEVWGPGSVEFIAGRDIALGTSAGIETIGNAKNPALDETGASLRLLAGLGAGADWARFIEVYLSDEPSAAREALNDALTRIDAARAGFVTADPARTLPVVPGAYREVLLAFLSALGIDGGDDPVAALRALEAPLQRALAMAVAYRELQTWGAAAETPNRADRLNYVRAYAALDTLFGGEMPLAARLGDAPGEGLEQAIADWLSLRDPAAASAAQVALLGRLFPRAEPQGDISLLLSQVQTLAGGDLMMMVPAGLINAGAADADIIDKAPADLGIVTAREGDIAIAVGDDLRVNSTRVFALQGDLLVWSSNGNIDAGKGAKTVTSVPDPVTRIDPQTGNTLIEFPPAVAGSGLQGENAALFAPRGAVNAGDAGIRTSGDLTIGAVEIVGADNIDVGGVEIGFSTADVAAVAPPGASGASSAASRGMESQATLLGDENADGERLIEGTQVRFISVDVLSFGENCSPDDEECR